MEIPSVMFLEIAKDMLKSRDPKVLAAEAKEFNCLGEKRIREIGECVAQLADNNPMLVGYLLGLETARALLSGVT